MTAIETARPAASPHILIENSEYWLRNNGDLAMLAVTIARVRQRWPLARIGVMTDAPSLLRSYFPFPGVDPITVTGTARWGEATRLAGLAKRVHPRLIGPPSLWRLSSAAALPARARSARRRLQLLHAFAAGAPPWTLWAQASGTPPPIAVPEPVEAAIRRADLVLALGGGYLTDADRAQAYRVLAVLDCAGRYGVPTALLGQGLGPLHDPALRGRARAVLQNVGFLGLREDRCGPALAEDLAVPAGRVLVTGDDAIELSYGAARQELGDAIGVCVRDADYAPTTAGAAQIVGSVLRDRGEAFGAALAPLPIAEFRSQDRRSTLPLTDGYARVVEPPGRYARPREIVRHVAGCRIVVTGAYHLAVFALAQGTPVIGLTSSPYYDDKFLGLGSMFGSAVTVLRSDTPELRTRLAMAVDRAWTQAQRLRAPTRERARAQIASSRDGFARACALVDGADGSRNTSAHPNAPDARQGIAP